MADLCIGTIPLSPDLQLRVTLTTERGRQVVDLRAFDRFAGVWMPSKKGLSVPAEHAEGLAGLTAEASARVAKGVTA